MKIRYLSDLHIDINKRFIKDDLFEYYLSQFTEEADVLIIAGDIAEINSVYEIEMFLDAAEQKHKQILWVWGNHEYYTAEITPSSEKETTRIKIWESAFPNLTILNGKSVVIDGVKFYGTTLWSNIHDRAYIVKSRMNDFNYIEGLTIDKYNDLFREQSSLLQVVDADIIITHHAPHPNSISERYQGDICNQAYYSEMLMSMQNSPKYWIHGHMHANSDYIVNNCRVLANPHGYGMENPGFDFNKIIEFST
jgi:predicted phosphodiesterase